MADGIQVDSSDINRLVTVLSGVADEQRQKVQMLLQASADKVLNASQSNVPVDTGDLKASGHVAPFVQDAEHIAFDVIYGDGSETDKEYDYGDGKLASGYAWFTELGTVNAPAQAYLGPAFEEESQKLVQKLGNLFS